MKIKVLGTGCPSCVQLERIVRKAADDIGGDIEVEKVDDLQKIMSYGVMMVPALVIDEKVVSAGGFLTTKDVKEIIEKNMEGKNGVA